MAIDPKDREILRTLAAELAEVAAQPVQAQKAAMWRDFNALKPRRAMVLAFPEGGWRDLVNDTHLKCTGQTARHWEGDLRRRLFHAHHIHDDHPITNTFNVRWQMQHSNYGLEETYTRTENLGSCVWDAPLKTAADFDKLRPRIFKVNRQASQETLAAAKAVFGDLLNVRLFGHVGWPASLTIHGIKLRGLEQTMMDIYDHPDLLHRLMAFLRDDRLAELAWLEREGLLSLNNGPDDYVGSGGLGCTDLLPASDFTGRVRPKDLWGFGECQEFVHVGPEHWYEFVLKYQLPILEQFAFNHYGCCEPLDNKYDYLFKHIPRLRRLSVSPWTDRAMAAQRLGKSCIFSWKPAPAMICTPTVDWPAVEKHIRETVKLAKGCALEMVMKDTHTFCGDPTRIERWSKMAREIAEG